MGKVGRFELLEQVESGRCVLPEHAEKLADSLFPGLRKGLANMIGQNIQTCRKALGMSQEQLSWKVGVSRQTVAKRESGTTSPDLGNAGRLAEALGVTVDDLVFYSQERTGVPVPPRGKHLFGVVTLGERGQVVIPKPARDLFGLKPGDSLLCLGDESQGIAFVRSEEFLERVRKVMG